MNLKISIDMKNLSLMTLLFLGLLASACGSKSNEQADSKNSSTAPETNQSPKTEAVQVKASERIDLDNKGVGPVETVVMDAQIDAVLAAEGEKIYNQMCTACHKLGQNFIGPPPNGIFERRSPEWVMNMILAPEVMVKEDPLAKDLLAEFNGSPMANQGLTEDQARAILEYFRTLK
jgi:mono/diheme cytochrome c family protein